MSWSSNIRALLCIAPLLLAACGFEPMHAKRPSSPGALAERIAVTAVAQDQERRRMAEKFRASLEDLLNPGGDARTPAYNLTTSLAMTEIPTSISRDGTIARYNVQIDAVLTLVRASDNAVVYTGQARRTGSYNNVSNAFYSTYVSSEDTVNRTAQELAEDVRLRMSNFFAQHPNPTPLSAQQAKPETTTAPPLPLRPGEL